MKDLNISGMMKNKHLSKTIGEQKLHEFLRQMEFIGFYKELWILCNGSGKSTIADSLKLKLQSRGYETYILHIDDFIHPKHVRYNESKEEWYCYYNIQWRYDYLVKEILFHIKNNDQIDKLIEIYDKENDNYILETIGISAGSILLLEGIFIQRKELRKYLDFTIYIDTPKHVRLKRVLERDLYMGEEEDINNKYKRRYFPAEEKYISEYWSIENANFVLRYR